MPGSLPAYSLVDRPLPAVRRVALSRPEERNALSNALRAPLLRAAMVAGSRKQAFDPPKDG